MKELKMPELTNKYTRILHEDEPKFGAPHHFVVTEADKTVKPAFAVYVDFQEGPIKENGVNGIANEDALCMVLARLRGFQETPYACASNSNAIAHIEMALNSLRVRTKLREERGIEGTSEI